MNQETAIFYSYANFLTFKRYNSLMQRFGSLEQAKQNITPTLLAELALRTETISEVEERIRTFNHKTYTDQLAALQCTLLAIDDPEYPAVLKTIEDPPVFLYVQGNAKLLHQTMIACVGTRAMSVYGQRVTQAFIPPLVRAGLVTISGLALGIDAEVARQTLQNNGATVAVLGSGLSKIFPPSNTPLAKNILAQGGALVSEYPLDVTPQKYAYPARNRIVAGLSQATLVLEAGEGSGALITATLAFDYNREVFAVPGTMFDANYFGCMQLIRTQVAELTIDPATILTHFNKSVIAEQQALFMPEPGLQTTLWQALNTTPQSIEELCAQLQCEMSTVIAELSMLELQNAAKNLGDGTWVKA